MYEINYEKINPKYTNIIKIIEAKPHVKYIRYLLSKRYSPIMIKKELQRLGLSASHEKQLTMYYLGVIDPVVKAFGLSDLYAGYKSKLLKANSKRGEYQKQLLNYRIDLGDDPSTQIEFCKFIKFLDIDEMWCQEIYKFHGSASNMPVDEHGNRIILTGTSTRGTKSLEKILLSDKRHIIDKLIIESVPFERICKYAKEHLDMQIYDADIKMYRDIFFNIRAQNIEEKIESLSTEKNSLKNLLSDLENEIGEFATMDMGEKVLLRSQTEKRIGELDDSIKGLNALYSDAAVRIAEVNNQNFESMFADIVGRSYNRFKQLDNYKDRDVVDPLLKVARIMSFAHDKVESIRVAGNGGQSIDKHSQGVMLELYSKRVDEIMEEEKNKAAENLGDSDYGNITPDEIMGLDETYIDGQEKEDAN